MSSRIEEWWLHPDDGWIRRTVREVFEDDEKPPLPVVPYGFKREKLAISRGLGVDRKRIERETVDVEIPPKGER